MFYEVCQITHQTSEMLSCFVLYYAIVCTLKYSTGRHHPRIASNVQHDA